MKFALGSRRAVLAMLCSGEVVPAQGNTVYRCPGNIYTDTISAKEAQERGCRTLEGVPVTVIQTVRPRGEGKSAAAQGASASRGSEGRSDGRIDPGDQRSRDSDARRILEAELRAETERLAALQ